MKRSAEGIPKTDAFRSSHYQVWHAANSLRATRQEQQDARVKSKARPRKLEGGTQERSSRDLRVWAPRGFPRLSKASGGCVALTKRKGNPPAP